MTFGHGYSYLMNTDIYFRQYDFELEQRNSMTSATNLPVVAITVVASAMSITLLDFRFSSSWLSWTFGGLITCVVAALSASVFYVFRSFYNYEWRKLPPAEQLRQHKLELHAWYISNGSTKAEATASAEDDFAEFLSARVAEAADWNGQNNIVRGNYLHRATAAVAFGVAFFVPAAMIYAHNKATTDDKVHQVQLINPVQITHQEETMSNKQATSPAQPASAPAPASAPVPSAKPSGPPNVSFKGQELTKPTNVPHVPKK
jgi:hypothetical protein